MHLQEEQKLNYISTEIQNLIALKSSSETNITTITKYYSLVLTAFFAYVVFYSGIKKDDMKIIYAILGLCFIIFATASTYYTTFTIIRNLKRRLIYRKEIVSLRAVANNLMGNIYKNSTVCPLDHNKLSFTSFDNLPTIAIMIGTGTPLVSFIFIKDLLLIHFHEVFAFQITFSICIIITLTVLAMILNLYTVHRKESLIVRRISNSKEENIIVNSINRKNNIRRKVKKYKQFKTTILVLAICFFFIMSIKIFIYGNLEKWNWDINMLEILFASILAIVLVKKNRFLNMRDHKLH